MELTSFRKLISIFRHLNGRWIRNALSDRMDWPCEKGTYHYNKFDLMAAELDFGGWKFARSCTFGNQTLLVARSCTSDDQIMSRSDMSLIFLN